MDPIERPTPFCAAHPTPLSAELRRSRALREFPALERSLLPALRSQRVRRARARIRRLPRLPRAHGITVGPWLMP